MFAGLAGGSGESIARWSKLVRCKAGRKKATQGTRTTSLATGTPCDIAACDRVPAAIARAALLQCWGAECASWSCACSRARRPPSTRHPRGKPAMRKPSRHSNSGDAHGLIAATAPPQAQGGSGDAMGLEDPLVGSGRLRHPRAHAGDAMGSGDAPCSEDRMRSSSMGFGGPPARRSPCCTKAKWRATVCARRSMSAPEPRRDTKPAYPTPAEAAFASREVARRT